jgi:hypothetical protein
MADSSVEEQKPDFRKPRAWWSGARAEIGVAFWWASGRYHPVSYTEFLDADYDGEVFKVFFTRFTITLTGKNLFELAEDFRRQIVWYVRERHVSLVDAEHEEHWISEMKIDVPQPSVEEKKLTKEREKAGTRKLFDEEPA